MGFVPAKAYVVMQLSLLLMSCFTVYGEEVDVVSEALPPIPPHHHARNYYPPVEAPSHPPRHFWSHPPSHHHRRSPPPSHPPVHPPTYPPSHPPSHGPSPHFPPRSLVAVQGVVYCKSCKYTGVDTLLGASPLLGAVVRLQCNNTKYPLVQEAKTDKNGYFFIEASKKITTYGVHKCKVSLVSSALSSCNKPTDLHDGLKGAILKLEKPSPVSLPHPFVLFSVGPFAFESASKAKCPP